MLVLLTTAVGSIMGILEQRRLQKLLTMDIEDNLRFLARLERARKGDREQQ
jgi:hypothetical protein